MRFVDRFTCHFRNRTSANGLLKTMHTGVDSYRKTRADGCVILLKPHVTFLGASNGVSQIDLYSFLIQSNVISLIECCN